jgi:hypothetical protein
MCAERDQRPVSVSPKRELADQSARILQAIDDLRDMEADKRTRPISTPEFHRLAEDVTDKSREIFRIAVAEERKGDESPRGDETIEDVDEDGRPNGGDRAS